jgi:D-alanine--poly(phosphoribitol) ligase subunit 2
MSSPEKILNLLSDITETDEVRSNPDLRLYDLQILDSMRTVELMVAVSSDLGVEILPAEFDREIWATPRKFLADILSRGAVAR